MGKRGPRPTPKPTLAARGSRLAKSRPAEPDPTSGMPRKPDWLGLIAAEKWDEVVPILVEMGCISSGYGDFIAMYCQAFQDLRDAMAIIAKEGMTCTSEKGGEYLHPAVSIKQNAIDRIARFGKEFGLSPASIRDAAKTPKAAKIGLAGSARKR